MENFIEENRFPILKKMDNNYLSRLLREKKTLFLIAIDKTNPEHVMQLKDIFNNVALKNRRYVFSYLDAREDTHLLRFFTKEKSAKIIVYSFEIGKHYILDVSGENTQFSSELDKLVRRYKDDDILWTTGYPLEDFLNRMGFNVSRTNLMIMTLGVFTFLVILLINCTCKYVDINKEKED